MGGGEGEYHEPVSRERERRAEPKVVIPLSGLSAGCRDSWDKRAFSAF